MNKLKDTQDSTVVRKIANDFVTMQIAIGNLDVSKAQVLLDLMYGASGNVGSVGSPLSSKITDQVTAISAALNNSSGNALQFKQTITQLFNAVQNTTSFTTLKNALDGIQASGVTSGQSIEALKAHLMELSDVAAYKAVGALEKLGYSFSQIMVIISALNSGIDVNVKGQNPEKLVQELLPKIEAARKAMEAKTAKVTAQNNALNSNNNALEKQIKNLQLQKKQLDANITAQERMNKLLSDQERFNLTKGELENKQRMAQASGNFLEANLLQQQILSETRDYTQGKETDILRNKSADIGVKIADMQSLVNANQKVINNNTTAMNNVAGAINNMDTGKKGELSGVSALPFFKASKDESVVNRFGQDFAGLMFRNPKSGNLYTVAAGSMSYQNVFDKYTKAGYEFQGYDPEWKKNVEKGYKDGTVKGNYDFDKVKGSGFKTLGTYDKIPARALGGPTFKNQMYLVGEKGPEFFVPSQNGSVIPNNISREMMNQSSNVTNEYALNLTFNGANMNPDDVARTVMDAIKRAEKSNSVYTNRRINT